MKVSSQRWAVGNVFAALVTSSLSAACSCSDEAVLCGELSCDSSELCCTGCGGEPFCAAGNVCPMVYCDATVGDDSAIGNDSAVAHDGATHDGATHDGATSSDAKASCGNLAQQCCDPIPGDGPNYCHKDLTCCDNNVCAENCNL